MTEPEPFPREHGPECEGAGLVHLFEVRGKGAVCGRCLGCDRFLMKGPTREPPVTCPACKKAPLPVDERSLYDTECFVSNKTESQQGAKLFGWGRR